MPKTTGERSIAITRPVGKGKETSEFVRKLGWTPFIVHAVELRPIERARIIEDFSRVISSGPIDWVVFMSPVGVDAFFDVLQSYSSILPNALGKLRLMAVGPKTGMMLERRGVRDVAVPETYSSSGVLDHLTKVGRNGGRVVLVRSSSADEHLAKSLSSKGLAVETITIYQSMVPANTESLSSFLSGLEGGQFQAVLFTSAVSASNVFRLAEGRVSKPRLVELLRSCLVGAIGPVTAETLRKLGINPMVPGRYLIEDAIRELVRGYEKSLLADAEAFS
jgi:uroporphyrinogen-III synthase